MNFAATFITRPVATTLIYLAIVLLGGLAYRQLPLAALPATDIPVVQVLTSYPGAGPDVVETSITAPLERYLGQISGLQSINSLSSYGLSLITLQFDFSRDTGGVAQDVQAAINNAAGWLPSDALPAPPYYRIVNSADAPVLSLALTSDELPLHQINELAVSAIARKLSQINGVGAVNIEGGQNRAVRLALDPNRMAAVGVDFEDVRKAVSDATGDRPKGWLDGIQQSFQIGANDQLFDASDYRSIALKKKNGAIVTLGDVARTSEGSENRRQAAWYNGKPAIILNLMRHPNANAVKISDTVSTMLPALSDFVPPSLKISIVADRTVTIRAALRDLEKTLLITMLLVILVIFAFLRNLRATLIPSVTLPVVIVGTFAAMGSLGFSLNSMSLMALSIGAAFIVDDAIIMVENISRFAEQGCSSREAAIRGARQILFTIVALTTSLVAVFFPLLLLDGVVGRLLREFAFVLSIAVILSGIVSLTLTPMMSARLMGKGHFGHSTEQRWARIYDALLTRFERSLDWSLRHYHAVLILTVIAMAFSVVVYRILPKGFFPEQDTGILAGSVSIPAHEPYSRLRDKQERIDKILLSDPDARGLISFIGVSANNPLTNAARFYIDIGPLNSRSSSASEIIQRLLHALSAIESAYISIKPISDFQLETGYSTGQYQYILQGIDGAELYRWAERFLPLLDANAAFSNTRVNGNNITTQLLITVDRQVAAKYGINSADVNEALYDALGQRQIASVYSSVNQYKVVLEADPATVNDVNLLDVVRVKSRENIASTAPARTEAMPALVPLRSIASIEKRPMPAAITHFGSFQSIAASFDLAPGVSLDTALVELRSLQAASDMPSTVTAILTGTALAYIKSLDAMPILIFAAVAAIYVLLGILYEGFHYPLVILSTLPLSIVGAFFVLFAFSIPFDLISLIGFIMLIGLVKKNGILMLDFAIELRRQKNLSAHDAIREACLIRFRPIIMTTVVAVLGAVPLAIDTGVGYELRRPLGMIVIGGMIASQFVTFYVIPATYLFLCQDLRLSRRAPETAP